MNLWFFSCFPSGMEEKRLNTSKKTEVLFLGRKGVQLC